MLQDSGIAEQTGNQRCHVAVSSEDPTSAVSLFLEPPMLQQLGHCFAPVWVKSQCALQKVYEQPPVLGRHIRGPLEGCVCAIYNVLQIGTLQLRYP